MWYGILSGEPSITVEPWLGWCLAWLMGLFCD
jgi:hypothetical protein